MGPFTPQTQDTTVYTLAAQLMADAANDGDRARIDRALDLVATVERLPSGQWSVPSSTGQGGYVVSRDARTCDCPDYARRETACKHIFSVRLAQQLERAGAEAGDPTIVITVAPEDSILDLWPVGDGEPCEMEAEREQPAEGCIDCDDGGREDTEGLCRRCSNCPLTETWTDEERMAGIQRDDPRLVPDSALAPIDYLLTPAALAVLDDQRQRDAARCPECNDWKQHGSLYCCGNTCERLVPAS